MRFMYYFIRYAIRVRFNPRRCRAYIQGWRTGSRIKRHHPEIVEFMRPLVERTTKEQPIPSNDNPHMYKEDTRTRVERLRDIFRLT